MRVLLVLGLLSIVSLSGCASGGGLNAYLVQPSDLPADCSYTPMDDPMMEFFADEFNLTGNPGSIDNEILGGEFGDEGAVVVNNLLASFTCTGDDIEHVFSLAMQFSDANATAGYDYTDDCEYLEEYGEEFVLVKGPIMTFVEVDGEAAGNATANLMSRMAMRLGVPNPCP